MKKITRKPFYEFNLTLVKDAFLERQRPHSYIHSLKILYSPAGLRLVTSYVQLSLSQGRFCTKELEFVCTIICSPLVLKYKFFTGAIKHNT